jgi:YbgC/YbaW family acyl-CoA thioester hydrolase
MPFVWPSRIRFVDTDASGRIHYTAMFRHFEAAEHDFLEHIGCHYHSVAADEVDYPRVHVECDFMIPIGFNEKIAIQVSVERIGDTSFTLAFLVVAQGQPAAKGKIVVVAMDRRTRRPCPLPPQLVEGLRHAA